MDGKSLTRELRLILNEASDSSYMDNRLSYELLWQAAIEFVDRTNCLAATQSITTVASQTGYTLNADFIKLYLRNRDNNFYIKYNDGSADTFILYKDKQDVIYQNSTEATTVPSYFYIDDDATLNSQISSTASAAGAKTGGQCTLTDSSSSTRFANVSAGDIVHNTTDGSSGYVISKTSNTALVTALFDGTDNDWSLADAYVIQPQGRLRLVLSPPPSTASHTATVYYIQRPSPVFADYGVYRFSLQHLRAILHYAAWLYKYRDRDPNFGDKFFQHFDSSVRKGAVQLNNTMNRQGFGVSFKRRS